MDNNANISWLDEPGIFDESTRKLGGRPIWRKSGQPHSISELINGKNITRKRKAKVLAYRFIKEDYDKRKRERNREKTKATTNKVCEGPCMRRYMELRGLKRHPLSYLAYVGTPEIVQSRPDMVYEVVMVMRGKEVSLVTYTSSKEALITCVSLAKYGVEARFIPVHTTRP